MSKAKWLLLFLLALGVSIPAYAVELTLGGFPSYMRTRAHFIKNATFLNAMSNSQAVALGFSSKDDRIMFVDTRLRLTPQLVLSDSVTIRAQVDVFDNNIWGGVTSGFLGGKSDVVNSSLTPTSRFRGALLTNFGASGGVYSALPGEATDEVQFFNVRMLHMDVVLPHGLGFVRVGRQPFDWGMGILANGGWDPNGDLGFVLDRFLWLKSWGLGDAGSFTLIFVSDRFTQGNSLVTGVGSGWDGGAVAMIYNNPNVAGTNLTIGGYIFPYIHQTGIFAGVPGEDTPFNAGGGVLELDRLTLYSGLIDIKTDLWRLVGEIQGAWGNIDVTATDFRIKAGSGNILFALRAEVYPGWPVKLVAAEFGWTKGDNVDTADKFEGGVIFFSPAYNLDNLLFRHIIPNIYQVEASVLNAYYARLWGTVKVADSLSLTPQVVVAWAEETDAPLFTSDQIGGADNSISSYLGTELELTGTWQVHPGVNFDLIGSFVIAGSGLRDLLNQQASATLNSILSDTTTPNEMDASKYPWSIQARILIYIDQFFK